MFAIHNETLKWENLAHELTEIHSVSFYSIGNFKFLHILNVIMFKKETLIGFKK